MSFLHSTYSQIVGPSDTPLSNLVGRDSRRSLQTLIVGTGDSNGERTRLDRVVGVVRGVQDQGLEGGGTSGADRGEFQYEGVTSGVERSLDQSHLV